MTYTIAVDVFYSLDRSSLLCDQHITHDLYPSRNLKLASGF